MLSSPCLKGICSVSMKLIIEQFSLSSNKHEVGSRLTMFVFHTLVT